MRELERLSVAQRAARGANQQTNRCASTHAEEAARRVPQAALRATYNMGGSAMFSPAPELPEHFDATGLKTITPDGASVRHKEAR